MATLIAATLHQRMTRARLFIGLDQQQMADELGKSRNTISAWERGANDPPISAVARWAQVTGRSIDWLVWGDPSEANSKGDDESRLRESNSRPSHYKGKTSPLHAAYVLAYLIARASVVTR